MSSAAVMALAGRPAAHPNDLDRKRIERAIARRKRYRYVSPSVERAEGGYRITSPCCSRNVDPEGGIIDVALLVHEPDSGRWQLFAKDHDADRWSLHSIHDRMADLLETLNLDLERTFWQ